MSASSKIFLKVSIRIIQYGLYNKCCNDIINYLCYCFMQQLNEVFQPKTHLHFGATVYMSCLSQDQKFYMYSNGISFKTILSIAEKQTSFDPSRCLFVITPVVKFQSQDILQGILKNRYNDEVNKLYDEKKTKAFIDQFEFQLQQNTKLKDQQVNFPIKYNESFMLQHVFSSKYLCFSRNLDSNEYVLLLSEIPSSNCIFNLKACFNYQKDINTYVPFSSAAFLNIKFQSGLVINEMNLNYAPNSIFDSWFFSQQSQNKINVQLYQTGEEVQYKNICFGDSVWIFHLESGSFVKIIDETWNSKSFIMDKIKYSLNYTNEIKQQQDDIIKSKLIIQKVQNEMSAQKFGLWQILPVIIKQQMKQSHEKGKFVGGKVKFDQQVRFFNIKYKAFLGVRKIKKGRNKFQYQFSLQGNQQQNTIFLIKSLSSNSTYISTQDLFLIHNVTSNTYLTLSVPFAINQTQAVLSPTIDYKKEDNFKFTKIDFLQSWQNNTLLSIMPFLTEGIRALKGISQNLMIDSKDDVMLRILFQNLIELLSFSFDLTQGFQASDNKLGKMTYNHFSIQKLLRQQGVIAKVITILEIINPIFLIQQGQNMKKQALKMLGIINIVKKHGIGTKDVGKIKVQIEILKQIIDTSLKILRNCCKSNTENSLILFKNIKTVIKYLSLGTYAQNFMMDSFNNSIILEKISIDELKGIIEQYIKIYNIKKMHSQKIFQLFSKLIKLGESKSVSKNQLDVYHLFFGSQNPLLIPIEQIDNKFYVKKIQLNEFCQQFPDIAHILGYQIKFCSQLAADRNYVCSKTMKKWFPLRTVLDYLIFKPVNNWKIKQSFTWIIINSYLNQRPRFKSNVPLVFSIPNSNQKLLQEQYRSLDTNFQIQMKIMRDEGLSTSLIEDIFSCVRQGDSMNQKDLQDLKLFVIQKIRQMSNEQESKESTRQKFYSSKMEAYLSCLKHLIQLSVFKLEQTEQISNIIEKIAKKVDQSLSVKKDKAEKLESTNFRTLLLQMMEKNVIKKFNQSAKNDGVQDQVQPDNICLVYVNYSFYQNILLEEKDTKRRRVTDSVIKIVLQLIAVYGQIKSNEKIKIFIDELTASRKRGLKTNDRSSLIKQIIIDNILQHSQSKSDIFNLLTLLFYNSNTYQINQISLNRLLGQIFPDRLTMEKLVKIQFNVDEKEIQQYQDLEKVCKNIRLLIETSEVWLNGYEVIKNKVSKFDAVILLFLSKVKKLLKIIIPEFDEDSQDPLFCCKFAKSIIPQKQQIVSNLKVHKQFLTLISQYRPLMMKIKSQSKNNFNAFLIPLFKYCYLFLYVFIYDSPENKNQLQEIIKQNYMKQYFQYSDLLDLGQARLIMQYLKNNYQECIQFFQKSPQTLQKFHKYTANHSRLLLTTFSYYNEPIIVNLRKFYISIFDFTSFKNFLWFKPNSNQLNLDLSLFRTQADKEPYLYHIHAFETVIKVTTYIEQSRNTIKQHIRKCLSQEYLFSLLMLDDFYTKENSNNYILRVMIHFKSMIMKIIQFTYFSQLKNDNLILNQLRRQNSIVTKFINEAPARQQNQDFRKVFLIRELKEDISLENDRIKQLYENNLNFNRGEHILQTYLNAIDQFCMEYKRLNSKSIDDLSQKMVQACEQIHQKVMSVYDLIHILLKNVDQDQNHVQKYPVPYQWLFSMSSAYKDEESMSNKRYFSSFLIESIFSKPIYEKFKTNQKKAIKVFLNTLQQIHLKPFLFLQKLSQYIEDAFQKLLNHPTYEMYRSLFLLINFLTLWIECQTGQNALKLRVIIGKSQLIFPMLNYFETCNFDKLNKELFLICLQFFNELIGQDGDRGIQTIFNQYFKNKADSIEFFMKIKQLFDAINFEDRANYKCKKIYDSVQQLLKDSRLENEAQFTILNFLIRLCKGNFRDNQIFLSSLSNISNFNIMSGIWEILKHQAQKYKKNLINVENYHLISQCFSTVRQLVEGPCVENQNQFLKRDFFLTVLDYFQFQISQSDLTLQKVLEERLSQIQRISPFFTDKLRIYLNRDKITNPWMPSQVKYRSISLICSLLSENVNQQSKSQLSTIPVSVIIKQIDKVYDRYVQLGLAYNYENLEVKQNTEIVLPLGFKLYELLQYYPHEKIPQHSPGLDFFRQNSRIVEVLHQNLCIVVFPRIPDQISQAYKIKFIEEVDRSSVNSKLRGLQDAQVQNKQSDFPYGYLLFVFVCTINILDIIIYDKPSLNLIQYFQFYPALRFYGQHQSLQILSVTFLLFCIFLSLIFLFLQARGAIYFREQLSLIANNPQTSKFRKTIDCIKFIWGNLTYFHYFITLILCIMGLFNPFFDALLLLVQLYKRSQTFSAIVDAITATVDQLLVVLLLTLVCTYVLTVFIYFYRAQLDYTDQCSNLYHCFVFSIDLGFRADAAIVGFNDSPDTILTVFETYPIQDVFVNFLYLFIIKIIIDQIIGAIIVDKFAALRQNKEKLEQDENSVCFICGLGRTLLDRQQDGFQFHKESYHNVWSYFQFLIYLRKSKLSNLSGIELFVYDQQKNKKLNWFPISRSYHMEMKNQEGNEKQLQQNQLQKMIKIFDLQFNQLREDLSQIWNLLSVRIAKENNKK